MDTFPNVVPKEEPESDCDEEMCSSFDTNSGKEDNEMVTEFKEEFVSEELYSPSGFDKIKEVSESQDD